MRVRRPLCGVVLLLLALTPAIAEPDAAATESRPHDSTDAPALPTAPVRANHTPDTLTEIARDLAWQLEMRIEVAPELATRKAYVVARDPVPAAVVMERLALVVGGVWVYEDPANAKPLTDVEATAATSPQPPTTGASDAREPAKPDAGPRWVLKQSAPDAKQGAALREQRRRAQEAKFTERWQRAREAGRFLFDAVHGGRGAVTRGILIAGLVDRGFTPDEALTIVNSDEAMGGLMFVSQLPAPTGAVLWLGDEQSVGWLDMTWSQQEALMHWLERRRPHVFMQVDVPEDFG